MHSLIQVNQGTIDATAGYGNTINSNSFTASRIADNDICDATFINEIVDIISACFNVEILPDATVCRPAEESDINEALIRHYMNYYNACPDKTAGKWKWNNLLTAARFKLKKRFPFISSQRIELVKAIAGNTWFKAA